MSKRLACSLACLAALATHAATSPARAADPEPIRIGVIAESAAISGVSIANAAQLAADTINAAGGVQGHKIEIVTYDDHSSSADAVRAFQRLAQQDHVVAVIGSFISEIALALEPWAARLHMPYITPGAASNDISKAVHDDYAHMKYTFHGYLTSTFLAQDVCDFAHEVLVPKLAMATAAVVSEDAAWTKPYDDTLLQCLPPAGLKVVDHVRFSPDTTDFTPIFNEIEGKRPDIMITGISHVGVQPTVQWKAQQVPIGMVGISSQATSSVFWKSTNGATDGVVVELNATADIPVTPKTIPFADAYIKRFGQTPGYAAYPTDDDVHIIADAVVRAGSSDPDKVVEALEQTDYVGTMGRIAFLGRDSPYTHALRYGKGWVQPLMIQWQDAKMVPIWPQSVAAGELKFPAFVKLPERHAAAQ